MRGVTVRHQGVDHAVSCDLLVLADGRLSRNADRVGAVPYQVIPSPWVALLAYFADLQSVESQLGRNDWQTDEMY